MNEKRKAHCPLDVVKKLVGQGKVRMTFSAVADASRLDFTVDEVHETVLALSLGDFYKSMTTYADHTVWQDVYRPLTKAGKVYLKLTVIDDVLIVSFKELDK